MQTLEAVLHLACKAAEAAAKSIEFVSREGDREGMGRQSPLLTREEASSGEMMQKGRRIGLTNMKQSRWNGVLCRCCGLLHLHSVVLEFCST